MSTPPKTRIVRRPAFGPLDADRLPRTPSDAVVEVKE